MIQPTPTPSAKIDRHARLLSLRNAIASVAVDAFLVPRADQHQGEYVAPSSERLAWLTGFTGSAGLAIVSNKHAAIFVDGRYTLQAPAEVDTADYAILQVPDEKPGEWLKSKIASNGTVGFDPWLHTIQEIEHLKKNLGPAVRLKALGHNPIDRIWGKNRPPMPNGPVFTHPLKYAGQDAEEKLSAIEALLKKEGQDAVILTMPDSICWTFNIRGRDIPHTPVVLAFAIVHRTGRADLFISPDRLDKEVLAHLKPLARLHEPAALKQHVKALRAANKKIRIDKSRTSWWFAQQLGGIRKIVEGIDPCARPKAIKNKTEIEGTRAAHRRDGAALTRFLAWIDQSASTGELTELVAATRLETERTASGELIDLSFDTISGAGPNGAIVHYRVTEKTNRRLRPGELYLIDSGGQYIDGTTDVTRTVAIGKPTAEMRAAFTAVLKGHIAIATARFPAGTRGVDLDAFARRALWQSGLDYDHGTGHGVGSFLSVHEGPASISKRGMVPLEPGMILSNEPGYYKAGAFGIRIENLVLVKPPEKPAGGEREMLGFDNLTLAPIDLKLIDENLLTSEERGWLDNYHARVNRELAPLLDPDTRKWLKAATAPLPKK